MKKIIYIALIFTIMFGATSCEKFFDINHDPDAIENAPIKLVLPAALSAPMYIFGGDGQIIGSFWAQHWTQATGGPQYKAYDSWSITNSTFDGRGYGSLYFNALADLKYIRNIAEENENWTYYLITNIVEAYVYQMLVDIYDQVPYSEAVQGDEDDGILTPIFDQGEDIYASLIEKIDNALAKDLNAGTCEDPGEADIVFGGSMDNWVKFANTLKLKIYLRQSFKNDMSAEINAMSSKEFLNTDASFDIFLNQSNKRNPIYSTVVVEQPGNISMSRTLMNLLVDDMHDNQGSGYEIIDKRVNAIANYPAAVSEYYRALMQGDFQNNTVEGIGMNPNENPGAPSIQYLSTPILAYNTPMYYFTKSESLFLQAEAMERFWGGPNSGQDLYEAGVFADFDRLGLQTDRDSVEILDDSDYAQWTVSQTRAEHLELIWTQKWVSMVNIQGMEAWIEHNRTDTPKEYPYFPGDYDYYGDWMHADADTDNWYENGWFTIAMNNVTSNRFPRRFLCPQSEIDGNPNVPDDLRNAQIFDEIWWDVEPNITD